MVRRSILVYKFHVVGDSLSHDQLFVTPWRAACQASLSFTISWSLFTHVHWVSEAIQPSRPPSHLQSFQASGSFPVSQSHWVPKILEFSISPSNEYSGLSSFRIDWLDLPAVQGTLKSLLQHHSLKASILQPSAFLMVQLTLPYMTSIKIIALTRQIFVSRVTPLLSNMLSRFVIVSLPRSKHLLISGLQSLIAVIFEAQVSKVFHCSHCFPIYMLWSDGTRCHGLSVLYVAFLPAFSLSSFTFFKRLFSSSLLSFICWCHLYIWGYWYFSLKSLFQVVIHPAWHFTWSILYES